MINSYERELWNPIIEEWVFVSGSKEDVDKCAEDWFDQIGTPKKIEVIKKYLDDEVETTKD
jgi:hypothetical protein